MREKDEKRIGKRVGRKRNLEEAEDVEWEGGSGRNGSEKWTERMDGKNGRG